jgi:hypothetical protein
LGLIQFFFLTEQFEFLAKAKFHNDHQE